MRGYSPTPEYNGWTNAVGLMKVNSDGNKIALAIETMDIFELFDFSNSTLFQYDITQANPFSNPIVIATETKQNRGLQLGPNGKIYVSKYLGGYLAEINFPNEIGFACGYESNAVYLQGSICHYGLPSIFFYP